MARSSNMTLIVALATSAALASTVAIVVAQAPVVQPPAAEPPQSVATALQVARVVNEATAKRPPLVETHLVGVGSCAASGCHGGAKPMPGAAAADAQAWRSSYIVWATSDPHARAYQTLTRPEAAAIVRKLDRLSATDKVAPQEDRRCTTCHATASPHGSNSTLAAKSEVAHNSLLQSIVADGVSCESCHGPAKQWVGEHFLMGAGGPSPLPVDDLNRNKAKLAERGMLDSDDLAVQAETCVRCHVGDRSDPNDIRDMNHDMIAAGHPALNFEFAAYKARMPRHWAVPTDGVLRANREAAGWLVGQLAACAAALRLSADRATASLEGEAADVKPDAPHVPWPEFSEFSCYRCHHALRSGAAADPTAQQTFALERKEKSTRPIGEELWGNWGGWHFALLTDPTSQPEWHDVRKLLPRAASPAASESDLLDLITAERALAAAFDAQAATTSAKSADGPVTKKGDEFYAYLLHEATKSTDDDLPTWETATQSYLAGVTMYRAKRAAAGLPTDRADDEVGTILKELYRALRFDQPGERRFNSPAHYDPAAVKELFKQLHSATAKGE